MNGAPADFGVFWSEGSGTVAIDTMVGYTSEDGTQMREEEKKMPSATNPATTDYSAEANPAIFNSTYTREIYNALQETILIGEASHTFREKVRQIAFYVCDRLTCESGSRASPRTVLVDDAVHTGNCTSYAHNFLFLCDMAGIPCILVPSEIHQWNEVFVENRWWCVDVSGTGVGGAPWRGDSVLHETTKY